jgi:hypothetical protein
MTHLADMVLRSWKTLNEFIGELREDQLKELIWWEIENKKRQDIVLRLHQRYAKLASEREREELLSKLN